MVLNKLKLIPFSHQDLKEVDWIMTSWCQGCIITMCLRDRNHQAQPRHPPIIRTSLRFPQHQQECWWCHSQLMHQRYVGDNYGLLPSNDDFSDECNGRRCWIFSSSHEWWTTEIPMQDVPTGRIGFINFIGGWNISWRY